MKVVHWGRARAFINKHPAAHLPLKRWRDAVKAARWKNFAQVREQFLTADWVDGLIVFDIKGNDFRLITIASFERDNIHILHVLTPAEYDNGSWKK